MGAPQVSRPVAGRRRRRFCAALLTSMVIVSGAAACGGVPPAPTPSPTPDSSPTATPSRSVDGIGLAALGLRNGPALFSLPRNSVLVTTVDQPNNVVLVLSAPPPVEVADYLREVLPTSGFTVSTGSGETFTFAGGGWSGSFTAADGSSAILLRPQ